jgi:type IV secretory pathway VirB2 component (pilin)
MIRTTMRVRAAISRPPPPSPINLVLVPAAHASGSSMPWEAPLQKILESIEGPVAKIVAVIIIIATGLTLAFGDTSGGFRKLIQIVFGLSIAFAAELLPVVLLVRRRGARLMAGAFEQLDACRDSPSRSTAR